MSSLLVVTPPISHLRDATGGPFGHEEGTGDVEGVCRGGGRTCEEKHGAGNLSAEGSPRKHKLQTLDILFHDTLLFHYVA